MYGLIGIGLIFFFIIIVLRHEPDEDEIADERPERTARQIKKLWELSRSSIKVKNFRRAEKALLLLLKFDQKNAAAYNRLGVLYTRERNLNDARECFEIAQSLKPSASSLHNVGMIYFEEGEYDKAAIALEQAIELEPDSAIRYIAYAKIQDQIGNIKIAIDFVERSLRIEKNKQAALILADLYIQDGQIEKAETIRKNIKRLNKKGIPRLLRQKNKAKI